MNCLRRRRLLAALRNVALKLATAWEGADRIVMVDIDFVRVSADAFVKAVALGWSRNASHCHLCIVGRLEQDGVVEKEHVPDGVPEVSL